MKHNVYEALASELYTALNYGDRVLHAACELSDFHLTPSVRGHAKNLCDMIDQLLRVDLFFGKLPFAPPDSTSPRSTRKLLGRVGKLLEGISALTPDVDGPFFKANVSFINSLYQHIHLIHEFIQNSGEIEIAGPRVGLAVEVAKDFGKTAKERDLPPLKKVLKRSHLHLVTAQSEKNAIAEQPQNGPVARYFLRLEDILGQKEVSGQIHGIDYKRKERYQEHMQKGHELVHLKKYSEAVQEFSKAFSFDQTAEMATLLAWAYGLNGKREKAKSFLLKAMNLDPDYGPPYNDLGSFLLQEGQLEEALKWFELAKTSVKYQNREYPYINSGRAYMMVKNYEAALREFTLALEIAPHNRELMQTVERLKSSLEKKQLRAPIAASQGISSESLENPLS